MSLNLEYTRNITGKPEDFWNSYGYRLKGVSLSLYYKLLSMSSWDGKEKHTYLKQSNIKKATLARELGFSRQSITTAFKTLENCGYIRGYTNYKNEDYYIIDFPLAQQGIKNEVLDYLVKKFHDAPEAITLLGLISYRIRSKLPPTSAKGLGILMGQDGAQQYVVDKIEMLIGMLGFYHFIEYRVERVEKGGIKYDVIDFTKVVIDKMPTDIVLEDPRTPEQIYKEELQADYKKGK